MKNADIIERNNELFTELKKYPKDSPQYRAVFSKIVENNQHLVSNIARRYSSCIRFNSLTIDDLISAGNLGLLKAIKPYDLEKGTFANYAFSWIKNYILLCLKREYKHKKVLSLEDDHNGKQKSLESTIASPVNIEADMIKKNETERQVAWVREHLDQLGPSQRRVIITKYLSGEASLIGDALAKELECTMSNISRADKRAIERLKEIYYKSHPEVIAFQEETEIELTSEEKIAAKEVLNNLIETKLPPQQKKLLLCKFYSPTPKTDWQVAAEINTKLNTARKYIQRASKKLCTLYNDFHDEQHLTPKALKEILKFRTEASELVK